MVKRRYIHKSWDKNEELNSVPKAMQETDKAEKKYFNHRMYKGIFLVQ